MDNRSQIEHHAQELMRLIMPDVDYAKAEIHITEKAGRPHLVMVKPYKTLKVDKRQALETIADELLRTSRKKSNGRAENEFNFDYDPEGNISSFTFLVTERVFLDQR